MCFLYGTANPRQRIGFKRIIAVCEHNIFTSRLRNARISCARRPSVLLVQRLYAYIRRKLIAKLCAAVCRAVVNEYNFNVAIPASEYAFDTSEQSVLTVVHRYNYRYHNLLHRYTSQKNLRLSTPDISPSIYE